MKTAQCLLVILLHCVLADKDHVTLLFVGDVSFSGLVRYYEKHNYHTYNDTFLEVAPFIRAADIAVGNLECVFVNKKVLSHKSTQYRKVKVFLDSSPESAPALRFAGFDAMSLANNHFNDFGEQGVHLSTRVLNEAGIKYFGVNYGKYDSPQEALIMEKNGIKIGFLGYWDMVTPYKDSSSQRVNFRAGSAIYEDNVAEDDIKRLKNKVDVVVVFIHWGNEFMVKPFRYQQEITKHLMSLGVDVIIGAHPHVIQPHFLRGKKLAAYSLGNFLFPLPRLPGGNALKVYGGLGMKPDKAQILSYEKFILQGSEALRSTLLFRVNVTKDGVLDADYLPLHFVFNSTEKRFHPEPKRGAKWIHVCGDEDKDCQRC